MQGQLIVIIHSGSRQIRFGDYTFALQSQHHVLDITRNLFGEEYAKTADSYHSLGNTQHEPGD